MSLMIARCAFVCLSLGACATHGQAAADNSAFMMVSGISASEEMCLIAASGSTVGTDVVLEPCVAAIAAGDGRELWQHLPDGQIANAVGHQCIGADSESVTLTACNGEGSWEMQGNGQLRWSAADGRCLSQRGLAAGVEDAAAFGAISASSTADAVAHGANMVVDGSSSTFWASAFDPAGPVTVTVDLGGQRRLSAVDIQWEFPAKSFTVAVTADGVRWAEVYATDSNTLGFTNIALSSISAAKVRVVMSEASGSSHGHAVYGMKKLSAYAPRLQSILEDCVAAAGSTDARDKYFANYVGEFALSSSKELRSELPSMEAARASLASTVSDLAATLPKMASCRVSTSFVKREVARSSVMLAQLKYTDRRTNSEGEGKMARNIDKQNGIDAAAANELLKDARGLIIAARDALF